MSAALRIRSRSSLPSLFVAPIHRSGHLLTAKQIAIAALIGTPLAGGLAIALNYFRMSGFDNKVNGMLAIVTGLIAAVLSILIVATGSFVFVTIPILLGGSAWMAHATAIDSFGAFYAAEDCRRWSTDCQQDEF